jgi:hypothetical protein
LGAPLESRACGVERSSLTAVSLRFENGLTMRSICSGVLAPVVSCVDGVGKRV